MEGNVDIQHFQQVLGMRHDTASTPVSEVSFYHRHVVNCQPNSTIHVLVHGYPQSNFMWRHVIPLLASDAPLFIPDIPGYGRSSPSTGGDDKRTIGLALLGALRSLLPPGRKQAIIMTGHDRGARICHRLAVDNGDGAGLQDFLIRGTILLDIVPTLTQWDTFKRSTSAVGHFHWPLLANVDFATELIKAQGGDKFCRSLIDRWAGKTPEGLRSLKENGALKVYGDFFAQASVIRASCQDYRAGAEEDVEEQKLDQNSRDARIGCPTLVIYSSEYLGSHYDVEKVWSTWVRDTAKLRVAGIKGSGHFIAEEAPVPTAALINDFWLENARSSLTPQQQDVRS